MPHCRLEFTPSHGAELQSEYLVPRARALDALGAFRALRPRLEGLPRVAAHVGLRRGGRECGSAAPRGGPPAARGATALGKCFVARAADLEPLYPRLGDFRVLRDRVDPDRTFGNAFLDRMIGG